LRNLYPACRKIEGEGYTLAGKKNKVKRIVISVMVIFIIAVLALIYGYINFEFEKLGESGVTPLTDWRSYLSYLLEKVPIVNNYVQYTPRGVIKPQKYYSEIYETYIQKIEDDRLILENKSGELNTFQNELDNFKLILDSRQQELDMKEERLISEMTSWDSTKERYQELASWLANGDEQLLAQALASDEIDVEEIVGGLRLVDPGIAAAIVGQLAIVDQNKAGKILANLSGKEVTK
jgi:hypothetical protein